MREAQINFKEELPDLASQLFLAHSLGELALCGHTDGESLMLMESLSSY